MHRRKFLQGACAATIASPLLRAEEPARVDPPDPMTFGHLRGRFVYDGEPPPAKPIPILKDRDALGAPDLKDESLLIEPKDKGLANVLIALERPTGDDAPRLKIHESYAKTADAKVVLAYRGGRLTRRLLAMRTTQPLTVVNKDAVAHSFHAHCAVNPRFHQILTRGHSMEAALTKAEPAPLQVTCAIHPWIKAYIAVHDHPYFAVTAADGSFEIRNIPMGEWTFRFWHEKVGFLPGGNIEGKQFDWPRGRYAIDIRSATTDLGEIKLSPELFER